MTDRTDDDLLAGNQFRETLVPRADATQGGAPLWCGWAIMEAFLAGAAWGRTTPPLDRAPVTEEITKAMVEAGARKHVIVLAELDKGRGFYVPGNPTLDKFSPELRADSLTAMHAALEAALAAWEGGAG